MRTKFIQLKNISLQTYFKSKLLKNMSWLFLLNFSNSIIPFFTFPYITRVFLPDGFGLIAFALSFIAYFQIFIDYGFNLTGTRKIANAEDNQKKLSKIFSSILATKFLFFVISIPFIVCITLINDNLYKSREIIFILIILVFSSVIMPTWVFQGLQRVKDMTVISLIVRFGFMISVFTLIKSPKDILVYSLIYSLSFLIIGILSMIRIKTQFNIKLCRIGISDIKQMIKDGFYVFTSSVVISIMGITGVFVLGLFYNLEYVGYYSAISKVDQVIAMLFYPIGQALFPYISKKYTNSFNEGYSSVVKVGKFLIPFFVILAMLVVLFRDTIVGFGLGKEYLYGADLLIIMAFLPVLSIISNLLGTQILVASGYTKEYSRAFLKSSVISIILYFVLGYFLAMWGVAIGALLGAIINLIFTYKEIIKIKQKNEHQII